MNELLANFGQKKTYPVGQVNGRLLPAESLQQEHTGFSDIEDEPDVGKPYEEEFVKQELRRYASKPLSQPVGFADDVSTIADSSNIGEELKTDPGSLYQKFNFKLNKDIKQELPIDYYKDNILSRIAFNQVVVIEGPTGCGKTTQVPQMILDSLREKNEYCNIVVTQPRRIATINVARRVCEERGWPIGSVCGYQIGLEKVVSPDQIITFMTIGVLLQKLIRAKSLTQFTHIIIDEVHERSQDLDFLLLVVRKFLFTSCPNVKVILMSATIIAQDFATYFRKQVSHQTIPAPIIKVDKNSKYTKTIFYLNQIATVTTRLPDFDITKPTISRETWNIFLFLVRVFDRLSNSDDDEYILNRGSILVFLPGINEIEEAHNLLKDEEKTIGAGNMVKILKWDIIPLHSSLPKSEQSLAFAETKPGCRKIILSTNIAESSVTVPDSCYVIDFCLTKVMTVDPITKYMSLKLEWASHVNCEQRAGRVGRTCDGRVYRLVPQNFFNDEMSKINTPEILRASLEHVVLRAKLLDLNETPAQILALALNPPKMKDIESTVWQLKEIGALLRTCRGHYATSDGDLTFLGEVMGSLPICVNLSKFIILGQLYSCLEETIIIAAGCSIQNIFSIPFQKRLEAYKKVLIWSDGSCSDLIALLNLYKVWEQRKRDNAFPTRRQEMEWCKNSLVNYVSLREWNILIAEIKDRLQRLQIKETVGAGKIVLSSVEKPTVLKVVMAGAFYPNFFLKSPETNRITEKEAVKIVNGRDPLRTIYFTGLDANQPGQIYIRQIKKLIFDTNKDESDVNIGFGEGSSKIYVEFKNTNDINIINFEESGRPAQPSAQIPYKVYEMIRKRQLKENFSLDLLPSDKAWEFARANGIRYNTLFDRDIPSTSTSASARDSKLNEPQNDVIYNPLPAANLQYVKFHISNHIDPSRFWVQNADETTNELLQLIEAALNKQVLQRVDENLKIGKIYVARFAEDNLFYRCKLIATSGNINSVLFIDYGNVQKVFYEDLYYLAQSLPCFAQPLAYECRMFGIKPAYRYSPLGVWSEHVIKEFDRWTSGILLYAEIYSVVNNIVEVELYRSQVREVSVNEHMVKQGLADRAAPSFLSKQDHEHRLAIQSLNDNPVEQQQKISANEIVNYSDFVDPEIKRTDCTTVMLKGPFSPLETRVYGCIAVSEGKSVDVEGTSVNAVLLDHEPQNPHARLLVAVQVGQAFHSEHLKLRQTTLMPYLLGFPMLLASIFCPTMEPKLTSDNLLVGAILCGMGYNEYTMKPLYPDHDMLIHLDTELTIEELEMINKLRYLMNSGIKLLKEVEINRSGQKQVISIQIKLKEHLFKLINMERKPMWRENARPQNVQWGQHGGLALLKPNVDSDHVDIWPLLGFFKIPKLDDYQKQISCNLEQLKTLSAQTFSAITCMLCKQDLNSIQELRLHVITEEHKKNLQEFHDDLEMEVEECT